MKVTITVPKEKIKQLAGVYALLAEGGAPEGLAKAIDDIDEMDISDSVDEENRNKLYLALASFVLQKIVDPLQEDHD